MKKIVTGTLATLGLIGIWFFTQNPNTMNQPLPETSNDVPLETSTSIPTQTASQKADVAVASGTSSTGRAKLPSVSWAMHESFDDSAAFFRSLEAPDQKWRAEQPIPRTNPSEYARLFWNVTAKGDTIGNTRSKKVKRDAKPYESIRWGEERRLKIVPCPIKERSGKVLSLSVFDQYDDAGGLHRSGDARSRCEVKVYTDHNEGVDAYYAWSFFIPNDETFVDHIANLPSAKGGDGSQMKQIILAQFLYPGDDNIRWTLVKAQPIFKLSYSSEVGKKSDERSLHITYGKSTQKDRMNVHSFDIQEPMIKGKWNTIILHFKWSADDNKGFFEGWLNGKQIKNKKGVSLFKGANLYSDVAGKVYPNHLKFGMYRLGQNMKQTMYFDEFRMAAQKEEVDLYVTPLLKQGTDSQLNQAKDYINCTEVYDAPAYDFYFPDFDLVVRTKQPRLRLSDLDGKFKKGVKYAVQTRLGIVQESNKKAMFSEPYYFYLN